MLCAAIAAGVLTAGCDADRSIELSFVVRGDALETLGEARLSCTDGQRTWSMACDQRGQSAALSVAPESLLDVVFFERESGALQTLGQRRSVIPAEFDLSPGSATLHLLQPSLRPITLEPDREHYAVGITDRWVVTTAPSATAYSHAVEIALLASPEQIEALASYHGAVFDRLDGALGLAIRSDALDLPVEGVWISMLLPAKLSGHRWNASWILLASMEADKTSGELSLVVSGIDEGIVHLRLSGTLGKGDNLLILRPGEADEAQPPVRVVKKRHAWSGGVVETEVLCVPVAPRPPLEWVAPPIDPRDAWRFEAREDEASRLSRVATFRTGGSVCGDASTQVRGSSAVVYDGWIASFLRCDSVGETDASSRVHLWGERVAYTYKFDALQKCFVEHRHEALLTQTWQVRRPRLVPGVRGTYSLVAGNSTRSIQSISMQLWGASVTSCGPRAQ
jgi:hypothetical protein